MQRRDSRIEVLHCYELTGGLAHGLHDGVGLFGPEARSLELAGSAKCIKRRIGHGGLPVSCGARAAARCAHGARVGAHGSEKKPRFCAMRSDSGISRASCRDQGPCPSSGAKSALPARHDLCRPFFQGPRSWSGSHASLIEAMLIDVSNGLDRYRLSRRKRSVRSPRGSGCGSGRRVVTRSETR